MRFVSIKAHVPPIKVAGHDGAWVVSQHLAHGNHVAQGEQNRAERVALADADSDWP